MVRTTPLVSLNHVLMVPRDAWAKHRDLNPYEAKSLYVDALLKVRISHLPLILC